MNKLDKAIGYLLFCYIILISCFCLGWWISYILNTNIYLGMFIGISIGIILNIIFLNKLVRDILNLNYYFLGLLYLIYSIGIFGFCMGVPVFNVFMGALAGWYIGLRLRHEKRDLITFNRVVKKTNIFCLIVLMLICISSAFIALTDPYTADNLKGMFNLNFEVTTTIIWFIIMVGGLLLILIQYYLTKLVAFNFYKRKID